MNVNSMPVKPIPSSFPASPCLIDSPTWSRRVAQTLGANVSFDTVERVEVPFARLKANIVALDKLGLAPRCPVPDWSRPATIRAGLSAVFDAATDLFDSVGGFGGAEDPDSVHRRQLASRLHRNIKQISMALFPIARSEGIDQGGAAR